MRIYNRCVEGVEIYFLIYSLFYTLPHVIWISTRVGDYHITTTIAVRTYAGTSQRRTHDIIKNKEQNSSVFTALQPGQDSNLLESPTLVRGGVF